MLAAHDAVTADSRKVQPKLGKLVNRSSHAANTASLDPLYQRRHARRYRTTRQGG